MLVPDGSDKAINGRVAFVLRHIHLGACAVDEDSVPAGFVKDAVPDADLGRLIEENGASDAV